MDTELKKIEELERKAILHLAKTNRFFLVMLIVLLLANILFVSYYIQLLN